jgi:hypothetical protein
MRPFLVVAVSLLAACASSPERRRPVAPGYLPPPALRSQDQGLRAAADRPLPAPQAAPAPAPVPAPAPSPSPAAANGAFDSPGWSVSLRTFKVTSERTAPPAQVLQVPVEPHPEAYEAPAYGGGEPCDERYWYPRPCAREPWVPVNTVVGATIGAAFDAGHCGHGSHGALVGAGIGFALDLSRLFCH